jgi:branched-chain amino acid transport system ATP-binding protein
MLKIENISSGYGAIKVLFDMNLSVEQREAVAIIGANGAGKTTLLRTITGLINHYKGKIYFENCDIGKLSPQKRVGRGIILVAEGHPVFRQLTVKQNLLLGAYTRYRCLGKAGRERLLMFCFDLFPVLEQRLDQIAATLSGGEQQMLAIAKGMMGEPKILLLDEPSLGLAPILIRNIGSTLLGLREHGLTLLLAEQNTTLAMEIAHRICVFENGRLVLEGTPDELTRDERVKCHYLGI